MKKRTPKPGLHKATGQAVVRIDGRDYYLGKYGTEEAQQAYDRLIAEWLANGRTLKTSPSSSLTTTGATVEELMLRYWEWCQDYYRGPDGTVSAEVDNIKDALRVLRKFYGTAEASRFTALSLRAIQEDLIRQKLARNRINNIVSRVKRFFKWATSFDLVPASVYHAVQTVPGLRRGRGGVKDPPPIRPVPEKDVEATLPFAPEPVQAMARLQLLTGCRPGEIMVLRTADVDASGPVWIYRPRKHKGSHRGLDRHILIGPRAKEILKPWLKSDKPDAYVFSPREWVETVRARRAAARKTKRPPSQLARKRKANPKRLPADRYNRRSYYLAIRRACEKAKVSPWVPLQLRHTAATRIRAQFGVEAAKVVLGHSRVETTQIYAERDLGKAQDIMAELG